MVVATASLDDSRMQSSRRRGSRSRHPNGAGGKQHREGIAPVVLPHHFRARCNGAERKTSGQNALPVATNWKVYDCGVRLGLEQRPKALMRNGLKAII